MWLYKENHTQKDWIIFVRFRCYKWNVNLAAKISGIWIVECLLKLQLSNKLSFLDVLVTRTDKGKLETQVYFGSQPTQIKFLTTSSNNSRTSKIDSVRTLFKQVKTHLRTHLQSGKMNKKTITWLFFKRMAIHEPLSITISLIEANKLIILQHIEDRSKITMRDC